MPIELVMPALSPTMEEGTIANWLVAAGQKIAAGDSIAEIETDKATLEYEAPEDGIISRILVPSGTENVAVNTPIAVLLREGENQADTATVPRNQNKSSDCKPALEVRQLERPLRQAVHRQSERILATPVARRLARAQGLDLSAVHGSGPRGRIVKIDVERQPEPQKRDEAQTAEEMQRQDVVAPDISISTGCYEIIPLDNMRRTIARRLAESKQSIPHFYLRAEVVLDELLALRSRLNAAAKVGEGAPAFRISVNDMLVKALALALIDVPDANVTWADGNMLKHHAVDVAVAVAINGGLITPVLRDAQNKSLSAISNELKDLISRAREKRLRPDEYQGGTTSVSNLGMYGVSSFDAIINPPHGTILAVGAGEPRCVVENGAPNVATAMTATLSVDHRIVDGAVGAELLAAFKSLVETPLRLVA